MKRRILPLFSGLVISLLFALPLWASGRAAAGPSSGEEFFIISSVDANKHQILLKRPTEVTELIRVNDNTAYVDEDGRRLQLKDLRAGDTVSVAATIARDGSVLALRIRKGIMTLRELHRRYLKFE